MFYTRLPIIVLTNDEGLDKAKLPCKRNVMTTFPFVPEMVGNYFTSTRAMQSGREQTEDYKHLLIALVFKKITDRILLFSHPYFFCLTATISPRRHKTVSLKRGNN